MNQIFKVDNILAQTKTNNLLHNSVVLTSSSIFTMQIFSKLISNVIFVVLHSVDETNRIEEENWITLSFRFICYVENSFQNKIKDWRRREKNFSFFKSETSCLFAYNLQFKIEISTYRPGLNVIKLLSV